MQKLFLKPFRMRPKRKKVPWNQWEYQSQQTRAYDTFFKGCGTSLFLIPFTLDFAIQDITRQAQHYAQCNPDYCTMYDEYCYETDFLHYRKFTPPPVRPVNRNYCFECTADLHLFFRKMCYV